MFPILFAFGPIEIQTSAVLLALGSIIGSALFLKNVSINRLNFTILADNTLSLVLGAIAGSRALYLLLNWEAFSFDHPEHKILGILAIWDSGLSFWGGMLGFLVALAILAWHKKENIEKWLDIATIPLLIVIIFSHMGAFFEGTRYGHETGLPWGILFEGGSVKYTIPVHPTQLYATLYTLILLLMLKFFRPTFISHKVTGSLFLGTLFIYSILTFFEGFLRGDDILMIAFLRSDQLMAAMIAIGAFTRLRKKLKYGHR